MTNVTTISILPVREPSVQLQQGIPSVFLVEDLVPAPMILLAHCGPDEDSVSTASASPAPRTLPARCSPDVSSSVFVRPRTSAHVPASSATLVDVVGSGSTPDRTPVPSATPSTPIHADDTHSVPDSTLAAGVPLIGGSMTSVPDCVPTGSLLAPVPGSSVAPSTASAQGLPPASTAAPLHTRLQDGISKPK
jgi:hypothetical protein